MKIQIIVKFGTLVLAFRPSDLDPTIQLAVISKLILTVSKQVLQIITGSNRSCSFQHLAMARAPLKNDSTIFREGIFIFFYFKQKYQNCSIGY